MGRLRAANGHPEPWAVKFWAIGNEMYGDWQLGHIPLSDYVKKHTQYAVAMKAMDPSVQVVAVGAVGRWSETMLAEASNHMDLISEHFYVQHKPGLLSHVNQAPAEVRRIAEAHRKYRATIPTLKLKEVPVALDEWNYWYGPHVYGELGTQYFLEDALGVAAALNEFARQTDVYFMANYAQTVNVIGAIKTSKTAAVLDTTGVILALYRKHFGTVPVAVGGAPEPLDVMACWKDEAKGVLTLSIVNPTKTAQTLRLDGGKARLAQDGPALFGRRRRPAGLQRARPAAGGHGPRNGRRPVRQDADGPADQRLVVSHRGRAPEGIGSSPDIVADHREAATGVAPRPP